MIEIDGPTGPIQLETLPSGKKVVINNEHNARIAQILRSDHSEMIVEIVEPLISEIRLRGLPMPLKSKKVFSEHWDSMMERVENHQRTDLKKQFSEASIESLASQIKDILTDS